MNYKALNRQELEGLARARFGEVLRYRKLKDEEIIEELEAYDRFVKGRRGGGEKMNEEERQKRNRGFVEREVIFCQSVLVDEMLKRGIFLYDDISNAFYSFAEAREEGIITKDVKEKDYDPQAKDIFEWWVVSGYLLERLERLSEPILKNEFGEWWGRTCTGQMIALDSVIDQILEGEGYK